MPSRIVRDGILTSLAVDKLSSGGEIFYRRILNVVDDFGRYHGTPALLRAAAFPLKVDKVLDKHIDQWVDECVRAGLLKHYMVDGLPYIEVLKFGKPRAITSKFPPMQTDANRCAQPCADESNGTVVVVESVVVGVSDLPPAKPAKPRKPHWSEPAGSELAKLHGCPKDGPWSFLSRLAREHTEQAVLSALANAPPFTNWKHAAGWLTEVAKRKHLETPTEEIYEDKLT